MSRDESAAEFAAYRSLSRYLGLSLNAVLRSAAADELAPLILAKQGSPSCSGCGAGLRYPDETCGCDRQRNSRRRPGRKLDGKVAAAMAKLARPEPVPDDLPLAGIDALSRARRRFRPPGP